MENDRQICDYRYTDAHRTLISTVEIVEQREVVYNESDEVDAHIELPEGMEPGAEEKKPWPDVFWSSLLVQTGTFSFTDSQMESKSVNLRKIIF